jgi:hypothetical protein
MLVTKQETIVLPRVEPTLVDGVPTVVRVKYNEPKVNKYNGSSNRRVPTDWSRRIHSVNEVLRPNSPCFTYCHQINIRSMNVHLLKIMRGKDLLNIFKI